MPPIAITVLLFLLSNYCSCSSLQQQQQQQHYNNNQQRTSFIDSQHQRVLTRLDQLDTRLARVQSLLQLRLDNIETTLTTTKLHLQLSLTDTLTRLEDSLARKWKSLESRFDSLLQSVDNKLETKLNAMQRDNRRYQDFLTGTFNVVSKEQEKLGGMLGNVTEALMGDKLGDKLGGILRGVVAERILTSNSPAQNSTSNNCNNNLTKVTNMFEDLTKKAEKMDGLLKETVSISNATRKDVHDGFRMVMAGNNNQLTRSSGGVVGGGGRSRGQSQPQQSSSSSEVMSTIILEALSSMDAMSSSLGRKLTELSRSVDERLELVSMSINGFLEGCVRVQEQQPLIEEQIAELLIRIVNVVENGTHTASTAWRNAVERTSSSVSGCGTAENPVTTPTTDDDDNRNNQQYDDEEEEEEEEEEELEGESETTTTNNGVEKEELENKILLWENLVNKSSSNNLW